MNYLWIALGGAIGSVARFWIAGIVSVRFESKFPWSTLLVNIAGSLLIGIFAALSETGGRLADGVTVRQFLVVGICGGFTTFSAFSVQTFDLMRTGHWLAASANIVGSVMLCLAAVWLGHFIGNAVSGRN